ncbi:MAG: zf-TFIIB domain-containing protein [Bacteroidetes bacterium]|nr:zf-TFIIB domain-containing protein [Bacteroidota bacterium]MBU1422165.1 zf-TFIIB domain-containing protein [Bacteroidota bacterium]MBU2636325.1 zf-TFIIB domain-containing protein [Bacteroidota bacterium]
MTFTPSEKEEERIKLRELHFMHCPKCGIKLIEMDYKQIKIDRCSECLGIWLDANELEQARLKKIFSILKK